MSRRRNQLQNEADSAPEEWIWGGGRGGGGAPLRDTSGNTITNLKKVIAGDIQVDFSPSPNKSFNYNNNGNHNHNQQNNNNNFNNNGGYGNDRNMQNSPQQIRGLENHVPYTNNNYNSNNSNNHGNNNNSDRGNWNSNSNRNTDGNNNNDGGNNHFQGHQYQGQQGPQQIQSPSFVGHGNRGSFTGANANMQPSERAMQLKKNQEFQNALREQVEETRRKKEEEKANREAEKRREYEHYMKTQWKGEVPVHEQKPPVDSSRRNGNHSDHQSQYQYQNQNQNQNQHNGNHNNGNNRGWNGDSGGGSGGGGGGGGGYVSPILSPRKNLNLTGGGNANSNGNGYGYGSGQQSSSDASNHDSGGGGNIVNLLKVNLGGGRGGIGETNNYGDDAGVDNYNNDGRSGRHSNYSDNSSGGGGGSSSQGTVSQEEYDKLSKLCERLLSQQEQQAEELRLLAAGKKSTNMGGRVGGGVGMLNKAERSQSGNARPRLLVDKVTRGGRARPGAGAGTDAYGQEDGCRPRGNQQQRPGSTNDVADVGRNGSGVVKGGRRQGQVTGYKVPEPSFKEKAVASVRRPRMPVVSTKGEKKVVAFGGRAPVLVAKKEEKQRDTELLKNGLKLAKKNQGMRRNQDFDNYDNIVMKRQEQKEQQQQQQSKSPVGGGGFSSLLNKSKNGPVVVTYDDDDSNGVGSNSRRPDYGHRNSNTNSNNYHSPVQRQNEKRSGLNLELRGSSHHLPVEGEAIRGDELDSLLNQARNIRKHN